MERQRRKNYTHIAVTNLHLLSVSYHINDSVRELLTHNNPFLKMYHLSKSSALSFEVWLPSLILRAVGSFTGESIIEKLFS